MLQSNCLTCAMLGLISIPYPPTPSENVLSVLKVPLSLQLGPLVAEVEGQQKVGMGYQFQYCYVCVSMYITIATYQFNAAVSNVTVLQIHNITEISNGIAAASAATSNAALYWCNNRLLVT